MAAGVGSTTEPIAPARPHTWNPAFLYPDLHNIQIPPTLTPGEVAND